MLASGINDGLHDKGAGLSGAQLVADGRLDLLAEGNFQSLASLFGALDVGQVGRGIVVRAVLQSKA